MRWVTHRPVRVVIAVVALLVVGLLSVVGYAAVQSGRPVVLPAPSGPDRVGRTVYDWTDHARVDPYAPQRSTPRELSVVVWYPADPPPKSAVASYWPPGWARALSSGDGFLAFGHTVPTAIHPHAVEDAPVAGGRSRYPVLVFAPGLGLQATDYTTIAEDLASHGYVVAGINPTYSTDVLLSGGRLVRAVPEAGDDADYGRLVQVWADDMRFVAGEALALDTAPGSRFRGRLEGAHIGFFGPSAGGAAATVACRHDVRCSGAVDIDGDLAGDVLQSGLGKPFLFLGHQNVFAKEPYLKSMLYVVLRGASPAQDHVLTVAGTRHDNFSDRGLSFNLFGSQRGSGGQATVRALRITSVYARAFFATCLQGTPSRLLRGPSSAYPEVRFASV